MSETASNGTNEHYKLSTDFKSVKESFEKVREAPSVSVKLGAFLDTANELLDIRGRWKDNLGDWGAGVLEAIAGHLEPLDGFLEAHWKRYKKFKEKVPDLKDLKDLKVVKDFEDSNVVLKTKDVYQKYARLPKFLDSVWCASLPGNQGEPDSSSCGDWIIDKGLGIVNLSKDDFDKDFDKLDKKVENAIPNVVLRECVYNLVNGKKPSDLLTVRGVVKYVGKSLVTPGSAFYSIAACIPGYAQCISLFNIVQKLGNFVKSTLLDPRRVTKEFKEAQQQNLRIEQLKYATGESVSRPSEIGSVESEGAIADMCAILRSGGFNAAHKEGFQEYLREQQYGKQGDFISGDLNSKDPDSLKAYKIAMGLAAAGLGVDAIKSIMESGEAESLPDMASDAARTARSAAGAAARGAQAAAGAASKSIGDIKKQLQSISDSFQPDMLSLYKQTEMLKDQVQSLRRLTQGGNEVEIQNIVVLYDQAATLIKDDIASKYIRKVQNSIKEYIDKV